MSAKSTMLDHLETSPRAKLVANAIYGKLKDIDHHLREKNFLRKCLVPKLKGGLLDTIIENSKNEQFKDDVMIEITNLVINEAKDNHGVEPYTIEVAAFVKDVSRRNALYFRIADFEHHLNHQDHEWTEGSHRARSLKVMMEAYARIEPQNEDERQRLTSELEQGNLFKYAESKFQGGDLEKALSAFKACQDHDMTAMIAKMMMINKKQRKKKTNVGGAEDYESSSAGKQGIDTVLKDKYRQSE